MERRFFNGKIESRQAGENEVEIFGGVASTTGVEYILYEDDDYIFSEIVQPGAFANVAQFDVRVLKNHDANLILGRTVSGTATVQETADGLTYTWKNDPAISYAADLAASIRRGDISQSSFGFVIGEEIREERKENGKWKFKRTILSVRELFDVSPVTFPANPTTQVSKRDLFTAYGVKDRPTNQDDDIFDFLKMEIELKEKEIQFFTLSALVSGRK